MSDKDISFEASCEELLEELESEVSCNTIPQDEVWKMMDFSTSCNESLLETVWESIDIPRVGYHDKKKVLAMLLALMQTNGHVWMPTNRKPNPEYNVPSWYHYETVDWVTNQINQHYLGLVICNNTTFTIYAWGRLVDFFEDCGVDTSLLEEY